MYAAMAKHFVRSPTTQTPVRKGSLLRKDRSSVTLWGFEMKKSPLRGASGGSCVIRTASIHAVFKSTFLLYSHLYPHKEKRANESFRLLDG